MSNRDTHGAWYFLALPVSLITPKKSRANVWSTLQQFNTTTARRVRPHLNPEQNKNTKSPLKLHISCTQAGQLACGLLPGTRGVVPDAAAKFNNPALYMMMQTEGNVWASSANTEALWKNVPLSGFSHRWSRKTSTTVCGLLRVNRHVNVMIQFQFVRVPDSRS